MQNIGVFLILFMMGLAFIVSSLRFHLDYTRRPIVFWSTYSSAVYAGIPLGIALLLIGLAMLLPSLELRRICAISALPFGFVGIIFGVTMPLYMTPWWFRYLRENYDGNFILVTLMREAAKDYAGWLERTQTMEGLVRWADEVQRRTRRNGQPVEKLSRKE